MRRDTHCARRAAGFTLIELLLVLVILAILAAIVVPRFTGRTEEAKKKAARTEIETIRLALDTFDAEIGRLPDANEGLALLTSGDIGDPNTDAEWKPMFDTVPLDPWGHEYVYVYPGNEHPASYDLFSVGPDGQPNTEDDVYPVRK